MYTENLIHRLFDAHSSRLVAGCLFAFSAISFAAGVEFQNMNIFASSGCWLTIYGLVGLTRHSTGKKFKDQSGEVASRLADSHPSASKRQTWTARKAIHAGKEVAQEVESEIRGLGFTIAGTVIWAYGGFLPDINFLNR